MSELIDDELDGVTGGAAAPAPSATGGSSCICPVCRKVTIKFSNRDTSVKCPNMNCKAEFWVVHGMLQRKA